MSNHLTDKDIADLRAFNRVYTNRLGLLNPCLDSSPFTLSEARLLYELAHRADPTAAEIARSLDLDRAQVSRTLKRFAKRGLVESREDPDHGRQQLLSLTKEGRAAFNALNSNTREAIKSLLEALPPPRRARALAAARTITQIFETQAPPRVVLRDPAPGDLGLIVHRQAVIYAQEFGWNSDYEALIAKIVADFHGWFNPAREAAWIADLDGRVVGSVFLVQGDEPDTGKLRLLYVEPDTRGMGVGKTLIDACIERARAVGYSRLVLWTNNVLVAARHLYQKAGFTLVSAEAHHSFGQVLVGEVWSLDL